MAGTQAHHILPNELFSEFHFLQEMRTAGLWVQNSRNFNLVGLPSSLTGSGVSVHSSQHIAYSAWYKREILADMELQLDGLTGAARQAKLLELSRQLIGVNNYLKAQFFDPDSAISLNRADGDGSAFFDTVTLESIRGEREFSLGLHGVGIPVWVDGASPVYSEAFSAISDLSPQERAAQLDSYVRQLETKYNSLSAAARAALDDRSMFARESAGMLLHKMVTEGDVYTPTFVSNFLSGHGPKVLSIATAAGAFSLFSPDMAHAAVRVIDGLDRGSALVDGLSLTLLGYAFVESGVMSDLDMTRMFGLLRNSNLTQAIGDKMDNIALDIGQEVLVSSIATMLGVGLLWKGYEIYQSIDGLKAALAVAAQYDKDGVIRQLNDLVVSLEATLDDWFSPAHGGSANFVPEYQQLADVLTATLSTLPSADNADAVWAIGGIIRDYILRNYPGLVANPNAFLATDLGMMLEALDRAAKSEGKTLHDLFEAAMVDSGFYEDNPALFALMRPTHCFAAGTPIDMADGSRKPIEAVRAGDMVLSFDPQGTLVPGRVARVHAKRAMQVLDFHGTWVTPGHVYLCGEGRFVGHYVPLIDILRSDGAVVARDGSMIRAATGDAVGSAQDVTQVWVAVGTKDLSGRLSVRDARQMRAGTRLCLPNGRDVSLADLIGAMGAFVTDTGLIRMPDGQDLMFHWTFSDRLPRPEDYVLARSGTDLDQVFAAGEWDDGPPHLPHATLERGRLS